MKNTGKITGIFKFWVDEFRKKWQAKIGENYDLSRRETAMEQRVINDKIYVVGHKNPDTDSICSAIAYADLRTKLTGDP